MPLPGIIRMPVGAVIIRMAGYQHHSATLVYPTVTIAMPGMHLPVTMAACVPTATIPIPGPIMLLATLAYPIVMPATALPGGTTTGSVHPATIRQTGEMPDSSTPMMIPALTATKKASTTPESVATAIKAPHRGKK